MLQWTKEKPTRVGYYWLKNYENDKHPRIASVYPIWGGEAFNVAFTGTHTVKLDSISGECEWAGPLEPPQ